MKAKMARKLAMLVAMNGLLSNCKNKDISMIRIFADGSTFIRFNSFHKINDFCQSVYVY